MKEIATVEMVRLGMHDVSLQFRVTRVWERDKSQTRLDDMPFQPYSRPLHFLPFATVETTMRPTASGSASHDIQYVQAVRSYDRDNGQSSKTRIVSAAAFTKNKS